MFMSEDRLPDYRFDSVMARQDDNVGAAKEWNQRTRGQAQGRPQSREQGTRDALSGCIRVELSISEGHLQHYPDRLNSEEAKQDNKVGTSEEWDNKVCGQVPKEDDEVECVEDQDNDRTAASSSAHGGGATIPGLDNLDPQIRWWTDVIGLTNPMNNSEGLNVLTQNTMNVIINNLQGQGVEERARTVRSLLSFLSSSRAGFQPQPDGTSFWRKCCPLSWLESNAPW